MVHFKLCSLEIKPVFSFWSEAKAVILHTKKMLMWNGMAWAWPWGGAVAALPFPAPGHSHSHSSKT